MPLRLSDEEVAELRSAAVAGGRTLAGEMRYRLFPPGVKRSVVASTAPLLPALAAAKPAWLPELQRLQKLGEDDPDGAFEEFKALCPQFVPAKGWGEMTLEARAAYLDQQYPLERKSEEGEKEKE